MIVLGISPNHDATVCIIKDGKILSAISRERLSRIKKDRYITQRMLDYVLDESGITIDDVDYVAITYWYENRLSWRNVNEDLKLYIPQEHIHIFSSWFIADGEDLWHNNEPEYHEGKGYRIKEDLVYLAPPVTNRPIESCPINLEIYSRTIPGWFVSHHQAHAASTFYTSNFERSAIFTMDSTDINPYSCSLFAYGFGNKMETLYYPGVMVSHAYGMFTELLNIGNSLFKAGSTMGLAPYGKVNPDIIKNIDEYTKSFWERNFDGDDWRWVYKLFMSTTGKVVRNLYPSTPQGADVDFVCDFFTKNMSDSQEAMDAAATIQYIFEQTVFRFLNKLYDETKLYNDGNLCLAGGAFLNCTTNGKIHKNTPFKNVSPYPGAGDDGLSVGCALYVSHHILNVPRVYKTVPEVVYTGKKYPTPDGGQTLDLDFIARSINDGKIIAWYQGGSEFGPRALGNRSFLANPTLPEMRDYINFQVKNREWYRPFAPIVCVEDYPRYFDLEDESPYMLKICQVLTDKLPSITHVDGSARPQTLKREDNLILYDLIRLFEKYSGHPVLLNTSLNLGGEPLVETPRDAIRLFENSNTDILVINEKMWIK